MRVLFKELLNNADYRLCRSVLVAQTWACKAAVMQLISSLNNAIVSSDFVFNDRTEPFYSGLSRCLLLICLTSLSVICIVNVSAK